MFGGIGERLAQSRDGGIQASIEVDEGSLGPQASHEFLAADDFPGALQQRGEDLQRLLLDADTQAEFAHLTAREVYFEGPEPYNARRKGRVSHGYSSLQSTMAGGRGDSTVSHRGCSHTFSSAYLVAIKSSGLVRPPRTSALHLSHASRRAFALRRNGEEEEG